MSPLFLTDSFRLHFVAILPLETRFQFVDQQPPGKKTVQRLARFAAAPDPDARRPMFKIHTGAPEKRLIQIPLETLDCFHPIT